MLYKIEFPSLRQMYEFLHTLGTTYTEINHRSLSIICECSAKQIEAAKAAGAKVTVVEV
jgi:hypothetical protein